MAFVTEAAARQAAQNTLRTTYKSASKILEEASTTTSSAFDIFLSHSSKDAEIILGVKRILEGLGSSVYVDWVNDPQLDRAKVSPVTANQLRRRMQQSASFIYVYTHNSTSSRWMPWELGYFDALKGNVAVLPVLQNSSDTFKGEEFLGLYPVVEVQRDWLANSDRLNIRKSASEAAWFSAWKSQTDKLRPAA